MSYREMRKYFHVWPKFNTDERFSGIPLSNSWKIIRKEYLSFLPSILRLWPIFISFIGIFLLSAQIHPDRQYQIKATFLYNFTQFVEWPSKTFPEPNAPIVIAVIGKDPFGTYLDEVISGESMNGHPLIVRRFNPDDEIKDCHILFINIPNNVKTQEVIESIKGQSILTVSDMPGFLKNGGMIRFVTVNNKIQFQINPAASRSADLQISSKLLSLAEIFSSK